MDNEPVVVRCNHCNTMHTDLDAQKCSHCGKEDAMMNMTVEDIVLQNNAYWQAQKPTSKAFADMTEAERKRYADDLDDPIA